MDLLQDAFPHLFHLYSTYYTPYSTYFAPLRHYILLSQSLFYTHIFPLLYPLYALSTRLLYPLLNSLLTEQPSLATLALLALLLIVSLKVLDMLRRTIIYWISLAMRMVFWLSVAGMGMWVWQRGLEQTLEDVGFLVGLLAGLGEEGERVGYGRADQRAREARRVGKGGGARARNRGRGGW